MAPGVDSSHEIDAIDLIISIAPPPQASLSTSVTVGATNDFSIPNTT